MPSFKFAKPSILQFNGVKIKEFPINTIDFIGSLTSFRGGYFRLMPYNFIKSCTEKSDYIMTYFHPRDFDFNQPFLPGLSITRLFKSYVGLKNCKPKLERWLTDYNFIDLNLADKRINWNKVPIVKL